MLDLILILMFVLKIINLMKIIFRLMREDLNSFFVILIEFMFYF